MYISIRCLCLSLVLDTNVASIVFGLTPTRGNIETQLNFKKVTCSMCYSELYRNNEVNFDSILQELKNTEGVTQMQDEK